MKIENDIHAFNRSKIFEQLDYQPEPAGYHSKIPWVVQQQIAATNGVHYVDRIGKLYDYPVYELPVNKVSDNKLMLDIGCGWGRWLIGGANKGYIPVGIDLRLEFCKTSRTVLSDLNKNGYTVVADLENLPFQDNVFDLVWSFSVIQHTHINRLTNCLLHINRILSESGFTYLEFPNKDGIRNRFGPVKSPAQKTVGDYDSWVVRYYSIKEYEAIFNKYLSAIAFTNHSFLGIGVLKEDLKYVSLKNKLLCTASLIGSALTNIIPGLYHFSDSIYIHAEKKSKGIRAENERLQKFRYLHQQNPSDNLNIACLLRCPKTGNQLVLDESKTKLVNTEAGIYYPVIDGIPLLIISEAAAI